MAGMGDIEINAHWHGWWVEQRRLVCLQRTALAYSSLDALSVACTQMCEWLDPFDRPRLALRCDLRQAPGRNDPAFEQAMAPFRLRMQQGFARVAILVATPVGRLQVQRHAVSDSIALRIFLNEPEADAYLDAPR
jgi:hypothetical protein